MARPIPALPRPPTTRIVRARRLPLAGLLAVAALLIPALAPGAAVGLLPAPSAGEVIVTTPTGPRAFVAPAGGEVRIPDVWPGVQVQGRVKVVQGGSLWVWHRKSEESYTDFSSPQLKVTARTPTTTFTLPTDTPGYRYAGSALVTSSDSSDFTPLLNPDGISYRVVDPATPPQVYVGYTEPSAIDSKGTGDLTLTVFYDLFSDLAPTPQVLVNGVSRAATVVPPTNDSIYTGLQITLSAAERSQPGVLRLNVQGEVIGAPPGIGLSQDSFLAIAPGNQVVFFSQTPDAFAPPGPQVFRWTTAFPTTVTCYLDQSLEVPCDTANGYVAEGLAPGPHTFVVYPKVGDGRQVSWVILPGGFGPAPPPEITTVRGIPELLYTTQNSRIRLRRLSVKDLEPGARILWRCTRACRGQGGAGTARRSRITFALGKLRGRSLPLSTVIEVRVIRSGDIGRLFRLGFTKEGLRRTFVCTISSATAKPRGGCDPY